MPGEVERGRGRRAGERGRERRGAGARPELARDGERGGDRLGLLGGPRELARGAPVGRREELDARGRPRGPHEREAGRAREREPLDEEARSPGPVLVGERREGERAEQAVGEHEQAARPRELRLGPGEELTPRAREQREERAAVEIVAELELVARPRRERLERRGRQRRELADRAAAREEAPQRARAVEGEGEQHLVVGERREPHLALELRHLRRAGGAQGEGELAALHRLRERERPPRLARLARGATQLGSRRRARVLATGEEPERGDDQENAVVRPERTERQTNAAVRPERTERQTNLVQR